MSQCHDSYRDEAGLGIADEPARLIGASVWESELYDHLVDHERTEGELLIEYEQAARDSGSRAFAYLASLIIEDEVRHHKLFAQLAESLRTDAEIRPEEPPVPRVGFWGKDPALVAELSERLMDHEHQDLKVLKHLRKELDDVKDTTMWALLVRLMEADTLKHLEILEFVNRHALASQHELKRGTR